MGFVKDTKGGSSFTEDTAYDTPNWVSDSTTISSWSTNSPSEISSSSFTVDAKDVAAFTSTKDFNPSVDVYKGYFNLSKDYFDKIITSFRPIFTSDQTPNVNNWVSDSSSVSTWT
jgi:hypothetical protein